uniref:Uncharacterized protein n=1 Tax=Aegilops tauschii subsp. strangulata TaxID=200361 RepID=A0A453DZ98_AEGTS
LLPQEERPATPWPRRRGSSPNYSSSARPRHLLRPLIHPPESWYVAWRTVLVHVPLVQEVTGLRRNKKPAKPKPPNRGRIGRFSSTSRRQKRRGERSNQD